MGKKKSGLSNVVKEKTSKEARRNVARNYGFKPKDYVCWMARDGYFFYVEDSLWDIELRAKTLYSDDLLWKIVFDKEIRPMSLRANGGFVTHDKILKTYQHPLRLDEDDSVFTEENAIRLWDEVFRTVAAEVDTFLKENPDADKYKTEPTPNGDQLAVLMYLCHHGKYQDAIRFIEDARSEGKNGWTTFAMPDGSYKNVYDFILEYCRQAIGE